MRLPFFLLSFWISNYLQQRSLWQQALQFGAAVLPLLVNGAIAFSYSSVDFEALEIGMYRLRARNFAWLSSLGSLRGCVSMLSLSAYWVHCCIGKFVDLCIKDIGPREMKEHEISEFLHSSGSEATNSKF